MIAFDTNSTANLPPFSDFVKILVFFLKKNIFFNIVIAYVFEKSSFFSCLLRQICYNLVVENFLTQNRTLASNRTLIGESVKKTFVLIG